MTTLKVFNNHLRMSFVILAILEATVFFVSVYAATMLRFNTLDLHAPVVKESVGNLTFKATVFVVMHMLGMISLGQYQREQHKGKNSFSQMLARLIISMLLASLTLFVLYYVLPSTALGRGITGMAILLSIAGIITLRQLYFHLVDGYIFDAKVLVIGTGARAAILLFHGQKDNQKRNYDIKGFVSAPGQLDLVPGHMVLDSGSTILEHARRLEVDEIILALDDRRKGYPTQQLIECKMAGLNIVDPVTFLEHEQGKINLEFMNPSWMIYSEGFSATRLKAFLARSFDIAASLAILLVTLPILLLTAAMIWLECGFRGPVFYRQVRVGQNGKLFDLLKFRSMCLDAEKNGVQWATLNDKRVTRVGRFIRKFRIDELPQIINILKGDMRLVGPRPERPEFVDKLSQSIAMYTQRHVVKPGLAGWAQLKYPYGASEQDAYEKLQYDLFYIKNSNIVMDFFILLQTLEVIIFSKGAR